MIYIAAPYDRQDTEEVMRIVNIAVAVYLKEGVPVYSPLSMGHYAGTADPEVYKIRLKIWRKLERDVIPLCKVLVVLKIPGWEESKGVQHEIFIAKQHNLSIKYVEVKDGFPVGV